MWFYSFGQNRIHEIIDVSNIDFKVSQKSNKKGFSLKNINCQDTLRYTETKEVILSQTPTFYYQELWRSDNEEMSMAFLSSHSNMIKGVEFLARRNSSSLPTSVIVQASIYSASQTFEPLSLIGSGTLNITDAINFNYYTVNFPVPLNVTGNYCVVIKPVTTNGIIDLVTNDVAVSNHDELFCRFKSDYYASSGGQWIAIPNFTEFVVQPANFEPIVAPIVSYPLGTQISATEQIICKNENLVLNAQITPNGIYGNRFYNGYSFLSYFNSSTIDSTLHWQTPGSTIINSYGIQANVQYNTVAQHIVTLTNNFGFASSCTDQDTVIITINEPNTNAGNDLTICEGESVTLSATGANTYTWNNNVTNGVPFTPNVSDTYIATGQSIYGCVKNDTLNITVYQTDTLINESGIDSLTINGITYYQSGTYNQNISGSNGCDSLITINLTIGYSGIDDFTNINDLTPIFYLDLNGKIITPRKNTFMFAVLKNGQVIRVYEMEN